MNNLITYLLISTLFFSCHEKKVQKFNENHILESKESIIKNRHCLTTISNSKICNVDDNKLLEKVKSIEKKNISFKASAEIFKNKVSIIKPNPISHNINDYKNLESLFSKSDYLKILNIKTSYPLLQGENTFVIRSYKPLNIETKREYILEADCFILKTDSEGESKCIIIIKKATEV